MRPALAVAARVRLGVGPWGTNLWKFAGADFP